MDKPILAVVLDQRVAAELGPDMVAKVVGAVGVRLHMPTLIERYRDQSFPDVLHVCVCNREGCEALHAGTLDDDNAPWDFNDDDDGGDETVIVVSDDTIGG